MSVCPICSQLKDVETSFAKYAAPRYDQPLPDAASRLVILEDPETGAPEKRHVRRCPFCGALYRYLRSSEYMINGSEEEEELRRLPPAESAEYMLGRVRAIENRRREIDDLRSAAGNMNDYIDRGHPSSAEEIEACALRADYDRREKILRGKLREEVESLRRDCPEILKDWADAHIRVCRFFLESLPRSGEDAQTARFVAREALEAWENLPRRGETFIPIATVWLIDYPARLESEINRRGGGRGLNC